MQDDEMTMPNDNQLKIRGMRVFHGTNVVIEHPKIINRFKTLDFGEGFYTTENENQARNFAVKVCERRSPKLFPVVNCYEFHEDLSQS
ncbi:MAG: DUF3990 domain-containing protein [Planctomycetaceae bacterium]|nr:DUF3990 domain-containing protein [Planctomycetaceae bacterium]